MVSKDRSDWYNVNWYTRFNLKNECAMYERQGRIPFVPQDRTVIKFDDNLFSFETDLVMWDTVKERLSVHLISSLKSGHTITRDMLLECGWEKC